MSTEHASSYLQTVVTLIKIMSGFNRCNNRRSLFLFLFDIFLLREVGLLVECGAVLDQLINDALQRTTITTL